MTNNNGEPKKQTLAERLDRVADAASIQASARAILEESLAHYLKLRDKSETALTPTPNSSGICPMCGRTWSLEQAVEYALSQPDTPTMPSSVPPVVAALTPRELEVLRLLAAGKSNQEIALARGVSPRTVANQLAQVFRKLEVSSRWELVSLCRADAGGPPDG